MADAVGGGNGTAAPAAAPNGSAPAGPSTAGGAPAAEAAPARKPILYKPKDADREYDVSEVVEAQLREHRRKVVVDGEEREFDLDAAFRAAAKEPASERRFQEAARLRQEASRERAKIEAANIGMSDPVRAPAVMRKRMGDQKYEDMILREAAEILDTEKMTPAQRAEVARARREKADLEERTQKVYAAEHQQKELREEAVKQRQAETRKRIEKEWPPLIKSHGVPEGFVGDVIRAAIADINTCRKQGISLTEPEAIRRAATEFKKKLPAAAPPPAPTVETIQAQPGRETSPAAAPPAQRDETGRFKKKGPLRPSDVLDRLKSL